MATIVKQRLLRTGQLEFTATTARSVDEYLVVVDERISKDDMAELWVATSGNPIPRGTIKQLGSNYLICDRLSLNSEANQGYIWHIDVHWKDLESDEPQQQSTPTPNSNSTDPDDWTPTWQRRTVIVFEPAIKAKYIDGYDTTAETWLSASEDAEGRSPLVNSAIQPIVEVPEHRRRMYIWTFRWIRPTAPSSLLNAEGKINSAAWQLSIGGNTYTWQVGTALIDSVNLSKLRWGTTNLTEISVEVAHDPEGWHWELPDKGTARRATIGDPGVTGTLIDPEKPIHAALKDLNGKAIQDPVFLDGAGQPLKSAAAIVYGEWSDFDTVSFESVGLLADIGSAV